MYFSLGFEPISIFLLNIPMTVGLFNPKFFKIICTFALMFSNSFMYLRSIKLKISTDQKLAQSDQYSARETKMGKY